MTSDSQHDPASAKRNTLPFEPKKSAKKSSPAATPSSPAKSAASVAKPTGIPQVVSQRMVRRMALFCGVPTLLGLLTFPASYFALAHDWLHYPHIAVVVTSLGFLGLGALGLSYGLLSSSWEEDHLGSKLGWQEFRVNFGRLRQEWRLQREQKNLK